MVYMVLENLSCAELHWREDLRPCLHCKARTVENIPACTLTKCSVSASILFHSILGTLAQPSQNVLIGSVNDCILETVLANAHTLHYPFPPYFHALLRMGGTSSGLIGLVWWGEWSMFQTVPSLQWKRSVSISRYQHLRAVYLHFNTIHVMY